MNRGFWVAVGASAGIYATVRTRRVVQSFTPDGLRDRAAGWALGAQLMRDAVAEGMVERETELRLRLGVPLPDDTKSIETPEPKHRKKELA